MAIQKKKKRKPANTKREYPSKSTVCLLSLALVSISYISVLSDKTGILGAFLASVYFRLVGIGAFLLPLFLMIGIVLYWINRFYGKFKKYYILLSIALLIGLLIIDVGISKDALFQWRYDISFAMAASKKGAGIIGAALGFVFTRLFGIVGTYSIVALMLFILMLIGFELSLSDVGRFLREMAMKLVQYLKRNKHKTSSKKPSAPKKSSVPSTKPEATDEGEKSIVISNYNDPSISMQDPEQLTIESFDLSMEKDNNHYVFPPIELLRSIDNPIVEKPSELKDKALEIEDTLKSFGIESNVVQINRGPTVTCFELDLAKGVKVSRITNLADNLSLSLATSGIRIEAPIPGKSYVGIEVPNDQKDTVSFKDIVTSPEFSQNSFTIPIALGKTISGDPIVSGIERMPHLLIAGATGAGKSVCINTIIMSVLYKMDPSDVKLLLIDPKVVELSIYNGIPHLVIPVVTDPKKASSALNWAVKEMERRYKLFSQYSVRDITSYREKQVVDRDEMESLPYIVIIIDELSDLMMASAQEVEDYICRLAQMSRACGIHLIIATQRPTVDVITGTIKANIPSRISFSVSSQIDSRTILDMSGAEKLLGKGDMLFYPSNVVKPLRVQGAFISDSEVEHVVDYLKEKNIAQYDDKMIEDIEKASESTIYSSEPEDDLYDEALELVLTEGQASVSLLQRKLKIGYARAGRLIDQLEENGVVGGFEGSKPRRVLVGKEYLNQKGENHEYSE